MSHGFTKVRDGEEVFVKSTEDNPLGYTKRQLACVGLPCPYCGRRFEYVPQTKGTMPTRDHFYARSTYRHLYTGMPGGNSTMTVMVCSTCNQSKKNYSFDNFVKRNQTSHRKKRLNVLHKAIKDGTVKITDRLVHEYALNNKGDPRGFQGLSIVEYYEFGPRA